MSDQTVVKLSGKKIKIKLIVKIVPAEVIGRSTSLFLLIVFIILKLLCPDHLYIPLLIYILFKREKHTKSYYQKYLPFLIAS